MREGWKWVEVYPEYPYSYTQAMRRIYPQSVPLSEEESAKLDELVARHDALSAEHGEDAPDDVAAELDRLAEEIVAIQQRAESYHARGSVPSRRDRLAEPRRHAARRARSHQARGRATALAAG